MGTVDGSYCWVPMLLPCLLAPVVDTTLDCGVEEVEAEETERLNRPIVFWEGPVMMPSRLKMKDQLTLY